MTSNTFITTLKSIGPKPLYVLDTSIAISQYAPVDLSVNNPDFKQNNLSSTKAFTNYINSYLKRHNAKVAYGGYNEVRNIYNRSDYFKLTEAETRNIHLGLDLWCTADTPIFAPLDGVVHSFRNNTNYGDYGPTIILQHSIYGETFYTLYGHLGLTSIAHLKVGQPFKQGEQIGALGDTKVNGDYPPHLHFQIIKDLQGNIGDYPGVCAKIDSEYYLANCPNPDVLLGML